MSTVSDGTLFKINFFAAERYNLLEAFTERS